MLHSHSRFETVGNERLALFSVGKVVEREVVVPEVVVPAQLYDVALFPGADAGIAMVFIDPLRAGQLQDQVINMATTCLRVAARIDGWVNVRQIDDITALSFVSDPPGANAVAQCVYDFLNNDHTKWTPLEIEP